MTGIIYRKYGEFQYSDFSVCSFDRILENIFYNLANRNCKNWQIDLLILLNIYEFIYTMICNYLHIIKIKKLYNQFTFQRTRYFIMLIPWTVKSTHIADIFF